MYSVLIHKATRGAKVAATGLTLRKAEEIGCVIYEGWKLLHRSFPELTVSGVCVFIIDEQTGEKLLQYGST